MSPLAVMSNVFPAVRDFSPSSTQRTWALTFFGLIPLLFLLWRGELNIIATIMVFCLLVLISTINKGLAICLAYVYLFLLGDIRRIFGLILGFPKLDPLLLVGPVFSIFLAVPLLLRLRLTDAISKSVLALMVIMTLEIANPRQGPIVVGISGAMFYLAPLLWFWIGREYGTDKLIVTVLYRVLFPIGVLAAILGICQTYIGFLPWESAWIKAVSDHYHALNLGGGFIRSFGFSVNSIEFSNLLLITSAFALAAFFAGNRIYGLFFPLLASGLFLASSRTGIVKLCFSIALAWAFSSKGGRGWIVRLPLFLAVGVGVLALVLSRAGGGAPPAGKTSAAGFSTQHQIQGLSHPFDKKYSTAGLHAGYVAQAIVQGFKFPLGNGLGSTTLGLAKLGGGNSDSEGSGLNASEIDFSDAFISMGVFGGLTYSFLIILILRRVITFARYAPKKIGLPVIAILAAMGGGWIALGQYGIAPLLWLLIGGVCRPRTEEAPPLQKEAEFEAFNPAQTRTIGNSVAL